jgi:serine/threonine-protein kinase
MAEPDDSISDPFELRGTTIDGKYRVTEVVGDGGFGVVYRGVHAGFDEPIAVKCLKLPRALDDKQRDGFLEQLREEGRLLHRLSKATPGIVQALDVGAVTTAAGIWVPYLILEWLEGDTLGDHLAKRLLAGTGPYGVTEAIRLLEPAVRALAVAHAMRVAHRDVKPHNLFVTRVHGVGGGGVSTIKVLDFGIAKVVTDYPTFREALAATQAAPNAFTPRYGAPEQFNKARGPSGPWTDVFALGLILIELLTGEKALLGDDPTQLYVASADPVLRPSAALRGALVPAPIEAVIAKAVAVEPRDRYGDAGELLDALLAAAGLQPSAPSGIVSASGASRTAPLAQSLAPSSGARTVPEARRPIPGSEPTELAPGNVGRTSASPGVGAKPSVDPMSETPFFQRHHLPPSEHAARAPRPVEAPSRARGGLLILAVLLLGGAAGAGYVTIVTLAPSAGVKGPRPPSSGIVFTTPVLPTGRRLPTSTPTARASASAATSHSATTPTASTSDMVLLAPGAVKTGDGSSARTLSVTQSYYLDRTEVTARAYEACVAKRLCSAADHVSVPHGAGDRWGPSAASSAGAANDAGADTGDAGGETASASAATEYAETWTRRCNAPRGAGDHPINCVDFPGAEAYCRWLGKRLPTEAEWELAARGRDARAYPWGADAPACGRACFDKNGACRDPDASVATCAAGMYPADRTPEGIYDLGGNVAEWTSDAAGDRSLRVVRGGSFIDADDALRATTRAVVPASLAHVAVGFRCALDAPDAGKP